MTVRISLKEFTLADMDAISAIEKVAFTIDAYSERTFADLFQKAGDTFLVAKTEQGIIGYIAASVVKQEGYIASVGVLPDYRRIGIGQMLVEGVKKRLIEKDVEAITLHVRNTNEPAIRFYLKLGFVIQATVPKYYSDSAAAFYMKLSLFK